MRMTGSSAHDQDQPSLALALVLLHADGDQFNTSLLTEHGGRGAAKDIHRLLREEMRSRGEEAELLVYLVADNDKTSQPSLDAFLRGFAAADELSILAAPCDGPGGMVARIVQLLFLYLPLPSTSRVFLGSLHTDYLVDYLEALPPALCSKITLVETVTVAPRVRKLIEEKKIGSTQVLEALFGGLGDAETVGMEYLRVDSPAPSSTGEGESIFESGASPIQTSPASSAPKRMLSDGFSPRRSPPDLPSGPPSPPPSTYAPTTETAQYADDDVPRSLGRRGKRRGKKGAKVNLGSRGAKVASGLLPPPLPVPSGPFKPPVVSMSSVPAESPCNMFYLAPQGCRKADCKFSHDFDFDPEGWKRYPLYVKSTICGEAQRTGRPCERGDYCIKGHRCPHTANGCPYGDRCFFLEAGLPHSVRS